jgi:hypothetical protein
MLNRIATFLLGAFCYLVFFVTLLVAIDLPGDVPNPRAVVSKPRWPFMHASTIDFILQPSASLKGKE